MNFYLADADGYYPKDADNAYVPDFFVDLMYRTRGELGFSLDELFGIDPYEDVKIENLSALQEEVKHLLSIPDHIAFVKYPYVKKHLVKLNAYLTVAINEGKTIISMGD